ncbi:MAG: universal stress protein [Gemmatimonadetes bacterium]|nr:universal stress protein [Gemmatimonadota bacterium]
MKRFQKILAVFDSEKRDWTAIQLALGLAQESGGQLAVVHVIPPLPQDIPYDLTGMDDLKEALFRAAEADLEEVGRKLPDAGIEIGRRVLWGHTAMELSRMVLTEGHDLVMKGSGSRKHIPGQFLGSVDMRLLRKCPCPVWLVKPGAHKDVKRVLATIDPMGEDDSHAELNQSIIGLGLELAAMEGADLHVLHAWAPWGRSLLRSRIRSEEFSEYSRQVRARTAKAMREMLKPFDDLIPVVNRHLLEGDPEHVVPEFVREHDVDVVVMGSVGRTGVPGFLIGNTAETILRQVESSVLAVKPGGFVSPVELDRDS